MKIDIQFLIRYHPIARKMVEADLKKHSAVEVAPEATVTPSEETDPLNTFFGLSTTTGIMVLGVATAVAFTLLFKSRK